MVPYETQIIKNGFGKWESQCLGHFAEFGSDPTQFDAATGGGGPGAGWRSSSRGGGIHHGSIDGGNNGERFSRKVFVGGLPPDIDEGKGYSMTMEYKIVSQSV